MLVNTLNYALTIAPVNPRYKGLVCQSFKDGNTANQEAECELFRERLANRPLKHPTTLIARRWDLRQTESALMSSSRCCCRLITANLVLLVLAVFPSFSSICILCPQNVKDKENMEVANMEIFFNSPLRLSTLKASENSLKSN